ncbi:UNVERIFIED_CONTAM: hypothetical protein HDU68_003392, partial [Siphonaria sp. JEL0065]
PLYSLAVKFIMENVDVDALAVQDFFFIIFKILSIVETIVLVLLPIQEYLDYYSTLQSVASRLLILYYVFWFPVLYINVFLEALGKVTGTSPSLFSFTSLLLDPSKLLNAVALHKHVFLWGLQWVFMYALLFLGESPEVWRYYTGLVVRHEFLVRDQERSVRRLIDMQERRRLKKLRLQQREEREQQGELDEFPQKGDEVGHESDEGADILGNDEVKDSQQDQNPKE